MPKIRCKIERKGGTTVTLDKTEYHFKPDQGVPGSPHLCIVTERAHIARLLSIGEGYEYFGGDDEDGAEGDQTLLSAPDLTGSLDAALQVGEDAVQAVLADPAGVSDDDLRTAFKFLAGRDPNEKAKRNAIVQKVISDASARGYVAEGDVDDLMAQAANPQPATPADPTAAAPKAKAPAKPKAAPKPKAPASNQ